MAKINIIDATNALRMIWNMIGPIKLVSINRNVIEIYIAIMRAG